MVTTVNEVMEVAREKTKGESSERVKYRILLKTGETIFKIGRIIIKRYHGDVDYVPSQRGLVNIDSAPANVVMDKITWHQDGRIHTKLTSGDHLNIKYRQPIQESGFQEVVRDTIIDYRRLPKLETPEDLDVILDIKDYEGPVLFIFSIVSGRLIVKSMQSEKTPVREISSKVKDLVLANAQRVLGHESGNADKLMQYSLYKYVGKKTLPTGRQVFVAADSQISRNQ